MFSIMCVLCVIIQKMFTATIVAIVPVKVFRTITHNTHICRARCTLMECPGCVVFKQDASEKHLQRQYDYEPCHLKQTNLFLTLSECECVRSASHSCLASHAWKKQYRPSLISLHVISAHMHSSRSYRRSEVVVAYRVQFTKIYYF